MPSRKKYHMLVTVNDDLSASPVELRSEVRAALAGAGITVRSVRPIPRGSDIARTRYKPRQGIPPLLAYMNGDQK